MSNDNAPDDGEHSTPAGDGFNEQPWHVLVGIRATSDPATPSNMTQGLLIALAATPEVMVDSKAGPVPDKANEAVHFAQWFDRNKAHLVALWRTEYTQYMNLRMLTERGIPGLRVVQQPLVNPDGSALQ